jgi:hypothetical protein
LLGKFKFDQKIRNIKKFLENVRKEFKGNQEKYPSFFNVYNGKIIHSIKI